MFLMVKKYIPDFLLEQVETGQEHLWGFYIYCVAQLPGSRLFTFDQHKNYITAMWLTLENFY